MNFTTDANPLQKPKVHKAHNDIERLCEVDLPFTLSVLLWSPPIKQAHLKAEENLSTCRSHLHGLGQVVVYCILTCNTFCIGLSIQIASTMCLLELLVIDVELA